MKVLVCGGGGFIGGHLVRSLWAEGHEVTAVDVKPIVDWWQIHPAKNLANIDLRLRPQVHDALHESRFDIIYNLAADMGGIGFIESHKVDCMRSVLININMLEYAATTGVERYFFASSACVYPAHRQKDTLPLPLTEDTAYPAQCEDGYGWEKLFGEQLCQHYHDEQNLEVRVARLHNVYGPYGTYEGGREKAPAAICRKVVESVLSGKKEIEIWGDGEQTRSFMYVDDAVRGIKLITNGKQSPLPVNLGTEEMVTINQLVDYVENIADVKLKRTYKLDAPQGVRGRNSENTMIRETYGWEPKTSLIEGLSSTYPFVYEALTNGGNG